MADSRHARITAELRAQIVSGDLAPGAAIPSEAELSSRFEVSRGTVRQALAGLRTEGLISGGRGRRPVVTRPSLSQSFDQMVSFSAWARRSGRTPGARTLELARRPCPPAVAAALELPAGSPVYQYRRVRLLDGEPVMVEDCTFIERLGRLLLDFDLDSGSVYEQLDARGIRLAEAEQEISAAAASTEVAGLLGIARRVPLLEVHRRVFDPDGEAVEVSHDSYRGDRFTVTVHNRVALARAGVSLAVVQDSAGPAA